MWFKVRRCGGPKNCTVLQRTTPVLLCTTKYCSSTTLYYKVLCQYWLALLCTTKCYSGTTVYYKELQRTSPVLLCTTRYYNLPKYYSSAALCYYKALRQYYFVLHSTTPTYYSNTTLYYKVLLQYYSVLHELRSFQKC